MTAPDEQGRPIIHTEDPDARNERERWVLVMGSNAKPEALIQEYETTGAHASGSSYVRPGKTIPADDFGTADLPHEVRHKLYKFLEEQKARRPKPHRT
jgi:hypothetical protein